MADWEQPHWSGKPQPRAETRPKIRPNGFARLARLCAIHHLLVLGLFLFAAAAAAGYAAMALTIEPYVLPRVTLDPQTEAGASALAKEFPGIDATIYAVVSDTGNGAARMAAEDAAAALAARTDLFTSAFVPGTGEFYERFGMLFLSEEEIARRVATALQLQPLFHALTAAPDLQGLAALVAEINRAVEQGRSPPALAGLLLAVSQTIESEVAGQVVPIDWVRIAALDRPVESRRWFVIATPVRGAEREAAIFAASATAAQPGTVWLWPRNALGKAVHPIRDLGVPAGVAALLALTLLAAGLGGLRYVPPVVICCAVTTCLAAAAAASLSPRLDAATWSFAAAVLAPALLLSIVLVLGHTQARLNGASVQQAIMLASHRRGGLQMALATIFLAFWLSWLLRQIPSLGLFASIALIGTLIAALTSVTLVPAALAAFDRDRSTVDPHWVDSALTRPPSSHLTNAMQVAAMLVIAAGVFSIVFLPGVRFGERLAVHQPPLQLDTPDARGAIHLLSPPGQPARDLIEQLSGLPEIGAIRTVEQFLPLAVDRKLELLRQLEGQIPGLQTPRPPADETELAATIATLETGLTQISGHSATDPELREAAHRLRRAISLFANPDLPSAGRVLALEDALFAGLNRVSGIAGQLASLPAPQLADLDPALRRRFISNDGLWRIEVMPKSETGALSFAAALRKVAPMAAGEPVTALSRNEIAHRETGLAFAAALTGAVLLAVAMLRDLFRWLTILPPVAFFFTLSAAAVSGLGIALNTAMLAALSLIAALSVCSAIILAERNDTSSGYPGSSALRAGLLPLLVVGAAVAPLAISGQQPIAAFGTVAALFTAIAAAVNALLIPVLGGWLRQALGR